MSVTDIDKVLPTPHGNVSLVGRENGILSIGENDEPREVPLLRGNDIKKIATMMVDFNARAMEKFTIYLCEHGVFDAVGQFIEKFYDNHNELCSAILNIEDTEDLMSILEEYNNFISKSIKPYIYNIKTIVAQNIETGDLLISLSQNEQCAKYGDMSRSEFIKMSAQHIVELLHSHKVSNISMCCIIARIRTMIFMLDKYEDRLHHPMLKKFDSFAALIYLNIVWEIVNPALTRSIGESVGIDLISICENWLRELYETTKKHETRDYDNISDLRCKLPALMVTEKK